VAITDRPLAAATTRGHFHAPTPRSPDPAQPVPLTGNEIAHLLASMIICFARRPALGSPVMLATLACPPVAAGIGKKPTRELGA
jgi:hypothetical protein